MIKIFRKAIILPIVVGLMAWSTNSWAFSCRTSDGALVEPNGTANVHVNLTPSLGVNQNLVVDLTTQIMCSNTRDPAVDPGWDDHVSLYDGSTYSGALSDFTGSVKYNGSSYPFPTTQETQYLTVTPSGRPPTFNTPWPTVLYLTPISTASGVVITAGSLIATVKLHQTNTVNSDSYFMDWNIYANNNVIIPTGGCDVSARDVTVTLPDYSGDQGNPGSTNIPLSVYCAQNQNLGFSLSGVTIDASKTVFANTASASPAQGIGVQIKRNGSIITANSNVSLGVVATTPVDLNLSATYGLSTGQVTAGNVQSIINLTFVYE